MSIESSLLELYRVQPRFMIIIINNHIKFNVHLDVLPEKRRNAKIGRLRVLTWNGCKPRGFSFFTEVKISTTIVDKDLSVIQRS